MENRRKKQLRNYYCYFDRREPAKNGGYPESAICPQCGRANTEKAKVCSDCQRINAILNQFGKRAA